MNVIIDYINGDSVLQLSKKYSIHRRKIQKILDDSNTPKQKNRKIIQLHKEKCNGDFSVNNIIHTHNVCSSTAVKLRKINNIKSNDSIIDLPMEEIIKLHINECKSASSISMQYDVHYGTIINKLGALYNPSFNNGCESKIKEFLETLNVKYTQNTRKVIAPLELDFYLPKFNLALEINGVYWHTELSGNKNKHYHKDKYILCNELGITLLQFSDFDITSRFDIVKSMIKSRLQLSYKIGARKCIFDSVTKPTALKFM